MRETVGPTRIEHETYGVWFPVPKNKATKGYTIFSPKSFENLNILSIVCTGIRANGTSSFLTILRTRPNLAMSRWNFEVKDEGKTFVQKSSPLPKLILEVQHFHSAPSPRAFYGPRVGRTAFPPPSARSPTS